MHNFPLSATAMPLNCIIRFAQSDYDVGERWRPFAWANQTWFTSGESPLCRSLARQEVFAGKVLESAGCHTMVMLASDFPMVFIAFDSSHTF